MSVIRLPPETNYPYYSVLAQLLGSPPPGLGYGSVVFNYKEDVLNPDPHDRFEFDSLLHINKLLDYAILKLKPHTGRPEFPPPITYFWNAEPGRPVYIIGHPDGKSMREDAGVMPLARDANLSDEIEKAREISLKIFGRDDYKCLRDENMVLFHTCFTRGSSGSPGVVISRHKEPVVVVMVQGGVPKTYYEATDEQRKTYDDQIPNAFFIEYGIAMGTIYNDMQNGDDAIRRLSTNIFPNPNCQPF